MSLSSWNLTRDSLVLIAGDSEADPTREFQFQRPLIDAAIRRYIAPTRVAGALRYTRPKFVNVAVSGLSISQVADAVAIALPAQQFTHVLLYTGTNEYTVTRAETQAAIAILMGLFSTQKVLLVGPYAVGEKYPTGQNVNDTRVDETDADLTDLVESLYADSKYISLRTTLYTDVMPPLNLPAPGATSGPFTCPDPLGIHYNGDGRAAGYAIYGQSIRLG